LDSIRKSLLFFGLLLILASIFGWNNTIELRAEEPRRAIVSMEMALSGNYIVPKINGWNYYNKPPVFNWVMVLFFKLFNSFDEWVVRFPSLLAYLTTALLNFYIVKRFLKKEVALLSSLFFLTSADLLFYGTVNAGEIDLFFSFLVYAQVMAVFWFFEKKQFGRMFLISYLLAAAGTLTKGPPSIAFQGLILLPWLIINREWKWLFSWKHLLGIFAYVLVVGGYFYWYSLNNDALVFMSRLFREAAQRTGVEHSFLDTLTGTASFPLFLLKLMAPWSLLIAFLFRKSVLNEIRSNSLLRFCVVFILFNIPLYWISADHRSRYLYMFFPFFCIVLGYFFLNPSTILQKWKNYILKIFLGVMFLGTLAFLAPPFIPQTAGLPFIGLKCGALILIGSAMIYGFRKYLNYKIYFFVLFIFLMRIGFNFTYLSALPTESSQLIYRDQIKNILEITKNEPVHWYGVPYTYHEPEGSSGLFVFENVKITSAGLMAYQIPYYITKGNRQILKFDLDFEPNQYYLARMDELKDKPVKVLYSFQDKWINRQIVLFKTDVEEK
jgi:4-amino-4-deoxy-L-arabinose transferase-like glycosyltransferase